MHATRTRRLVQLMDQLKEDIIDVPIALLIGEAEEKHALIKKLSGLDLHDTLSQQCPVELRLLERDDDRWVCEISLKIRYDANGKELPSCTELTFQSELYDQAKASLAVRRAQKALLNPSQDFARYRTHLLDEEKDEICYTPNLLCIKISGANTDLTLLDLPATHASAEVASGTYEDGAREAALKTIRSENTLVVAVYAKDSQRRATLHEIIQDNKVSHRAIGFVFSNPEEVTEDVLTQLEKSHPLQLGYHRLSHEECSLGQDTDSFDGDSSTDAETCFNRIQGVRLSEGFLSKAFAEFVSQKLPQMHSEISEKIKGVVQEKASLKSTSSKANVELFRLVKAFSDAVKGSVEGTVGSNVSETLEAHVRMLNEILNITQPRLFLAPHMPKHHILYVTEYTDEHCYWHFPHHEINHRAEKGSGFNNLMKNSTLQDMVLKCQRDWGLRALECAESSAQTLREVIHRAVDSVFAKHNSLLWKIKYKADAFLEKQSSVVRESILRAFQLETKCPTAWNTLDLNNRIKYMKCVLFWPFCNQLGSSGRDLFGTLVAYYDVAVLRFCDNVAMAIKYQYCHQLPNDIHEYLVQELESLSSNLAEGDPTLSICQARLDSKLAMLQHLQDALFSA